MKWLATKRLASEVSQMLSFLLLILCRDLKGYFSMKKHQDEYTRDPNFVLWSFHSPWKVFAWDAVKCFSAFLGAGNDPEVLYNSTEHAEPSFITSGLFLWTWPLIVVHQYRFWACLRINQMATILLRIVWSCHERSASYQWFWQNFISVDSVVSQTG